MNCRICGIEMLAGGRIPDLWYCPHDLTYQTGGTEIARYEESYFGSDYQAQYGRTYTEDRDNIRNRQKLRSCFLRNYLRTPVKRILEVGSAAGFCLELMREETGAEITGFELSVAMSNYANEHGIPTLQGDAIQLSQLHLSLDLPLFDLVLVYYVAEHFPEPVLFWEAVLKLMVPGGLISMALPSVFGPLFWFHPEKWRDTHPTDHFVDYSPAAVAAVGRRFGFRLLGVAPEGIHPTRIPGPGLLHDAYRTVIRTAGFSDTMHVVLQKL